MKLGRNEKLVKRKVAVLFKSLGVWYTMPSQAGYSQAGVPDFLACVRGKFLGVECKSGGNTTTPHQEQQLEAIRASGGAAIVVDEKNLESFRTVIQEWCR